MSDYAAFLDRKASIAPMRGLSRIPDFNPAMFEYQRACAEFLLRTGCGAAFLDTGLGKSIIALDWGRIISEHTDKPVLMLAPLAVSHQHAREARKFGIPDVRVVRDASEVGPGINVTNYERLDKFNAETFGGLIADESSIIKNFTGKTTRKMMALFANTPFRLACTATPAPNDHMELGQHSQFLGVMDSPEMLSRWFITDPSQMGKYRIKHYAVTSFWNWVASWSRCVSKPSDLGYSDEGFTLPALVEKHHMVRADVSVDTGEERDGQLRLLRVPDTSATAIHKEKRHTSRQRAEVIAEIIRTDKGEPWIVWCDTDYEADHLTELIPDAVEIRGSMPAETKEARLLAFSEGNVRVIITKPRIAGHGLNWQHCARMAFVGLSFSYEAYYQAIRRCWRFGQTRPVEVHVAMADTERAIWDTIKRKTNDHGEMKVEMTAAMRRSHESRTVRIDYNATAPMQLPTWLRGTPT